MIVPTLPYTDGLAERAGGGQGGQAVAPKKVADANRHILSSIDPIDSLTVGTEQSSSGQKDDFQHRHKHQTIGESEKSSDSYQISSIKHQTKRNI